MTLGVGDSANLMKSRYLAVETGNPFPHQKYSLQWVYINDIYHYRSSLWVKEQSLSFSGTAEAKLFGFRRSFASRATKCGSGRPTKGYCWNRLSPIRESGLRSWID